MRVATVAVPLVLVVALASCGRDAQAPRAGADLASRPAVRGDGHCDFDLSADKAVTVFRVLGFLEEYNGRAIMEDGEGVERLFCDERHLADEFRAALERLSAEQGLAAPTQSTEQECLTFFASATLTPRLDSCYRFELTDGITAVAPHGRGRRRVTTGRFNFDLLYGNGGVDRLRARAYLQGAWRRWGRAGAFTFANSSHKAEGIAFLLGQLGCTEVVIHHSVGTIPQGYRVTFTPTDEVAGWLEMSRSAR